MMKIILIGFVFFFILYICMGIINICIGIIDYFYLTPEEEINSYLKKANNGSEEATQKLIDIVQKKESFPQYKLVLRLVLQGICKLKSSKAINLFCQAWANTRNRELEAILLKAGYVANQPDKTRALTALKINKIETCIEENPQLIKIVLEYFEDQDTEIAQRARQTAISLTHEGAINYLFHLYVAENNQLAYQSIQKANYQSTDIQYRALFHFIREEWDAYDALDFDQSILQEVYKSVGTELRKAIAEKARKRGWTEWIKIAKKSREKMTTEEWESTIAILKSNKDYAQMWQLVRQAPIWVCQELLLELAHYTYQFTPASQDFVKRLSELAIQCSCSPVAYTISSSDFKPLCSAEGGYKEISPDCQFLVTYDKDNKWTKVWRIGDGQLLCSAEGDYEEISADWQFLITYQYPNRTKVWRIGDGQLLCSAEGGYKEISPDCQFLVTYDKDNKWTKVWRIADGQLLCSAEGGYKEISPDCQFLVTYNYSNWTKVWRIADGQLLCSAEGYCQEISPDWQFLVTYQYPEWTKVWRIADDQLLCSAEGDYKEISPDWQFLVTWSDLIWTKMWRIRDGQLLCSAEGGYKEISPDWQFLVTYDDKDEKCPKVWRIADGQLLCSAEGGYKEVSPDWQFLVTDKSLDWTKVWRIADGQLLCSAEGGYKEISPDWQFLVTYQYPEWTKVWRIGDGQLLCSAEGNYEEISPDWQFLVTWSDLIWTKMWRIRDGQLLYFTKGYCRKISPDWQFLLACDKGGKYPKVWRIGDGQLLCSAEGNYEEISPDWQFLVTCDKDNKCPKVWRIGDGQFLWSSQEKYKEISPDWQFLVTYQYPDWTKVWRIGDGQLLWSSQEKYKEISPNWHFLITFNDKDRKCPKVWRINTSVVSYFSYKFIDQLTVNDMKFLKDTKNQTSDYVYPKISDEEKPWLDFMIALAKYKLMFDFDIAEDISSNELSEFDIEIEG